MPQSKYLFDFISLDLPPSFPPVCRSVCLQTLRVTVKMDLLEFRLSIRLQFSTPFKARVWTIKVFSGGKRAVLASRTTNSLSQQQLLARSHLLRFVGVFHNWNWKWEKNRELQLLICIGAAPRPRWAQVSVTGHPAHPQGISTSVLFCKKRLNPALWERRGGYSTCSHLQCPQPAHFSPATKQPGDVSLLVAHSQPHGGIPLRKPLFQLSCLWL